MDNQNPPFPPPPPGNPYQQNPYMNNPMGGMQQDLPNHIGILVLGIVSIVMCWCYGIPGLVCGIIALVMGNKSMRLYNDNPNVYSEKSYKNAKAGRICAIIGTCLSVLTIFYFIFWFMFFGAALSQFPWQRLH